LRGKFEDLFEVGDDMQAVFVELHFAYHVTGAVLVVLLVLGRSLSAV
jgi:hypothetical protein